MAYWAAAQIKTDQARRAVWHIERQGFEVYAPVCRTSRRSAKVVPLFPGYLFVSIVDRWRCLLGTHGVIDVLRAGDAPNLNRKAAGKKGFAAKHFPMVARVDPDALGQRPARDAHALAKVVRDKAAAITSCSRNSIETSRSNMVNMIRTRSRADMKRG